MDIYEQMIRYFSDAPDLTTWEEVQALFQDVGTSKPHHWRLPILACQAVGGSLDQVLPAAVAMACGYISIILVDDMLDADPRGEYHRLGMPAVANMACAFQAAALAVLDHCELADMSKKMAMDDMNQMILTTSLGQYWDTLCLPDEAAYWRVVHTKSSPFFGSALYIGTLAGGGNVGVARRLKELGLLYGEMVQILDDLDDAMDVPASPDWTSGRSTLPILFARLVEHPDQQRFIELCREPLDETGLAEAQTILIHCGAISYGIDQLIHRYKKSRSILETLSLCAPQSLLEMIEETIYPVDKLFEALGIPQFSSPV